MTYMGLHFVDLLQVFMLAMLVVGFAAKLAHDENDGDLLGTFVTTLAVWIIATAIVIAAVIAAFFGVIYALVYFEIEFGWMDFL